jgi:hypothetical protein
MSHAIGFAHALLQGAAEAFDNHKRGMEILKTLTEVELAEMSEDTNFARQATAAGSNAIN